MRDRATGSTPARAQDAELGHPVPAQRRRLLRPVRAGRAQPPAATSLSSRYNKTIIYDPPRQLDLFGSARIYHRARAAPERAEHRQPEEHRLVRGRRQIYQHHARRSAGSTMKRGFAWRALADLDYRRRATPFPSFTAASIMASRCPARTARSGFTATRRPGRRQRAPPAGRVLLRLVPQQLCR